MNPLTKQGIAAYKAGNKAEARRLLKLALQQDATDIPAWLCLSGAVEEAADQAYCFQMVLRLDPNNMIAHTGMAKIEQNRRRDAEQAAAAAGEDVPLPDFRAELLYAPPFTTDITNTFKEEPAAPLPDIWAATEEPVILQETSAAAYAKSTPPAPSVMEQPAPPRKAKKAPARTARKGARRSKKKKSAFQPWMWVAIGGMALLLLFTFAFLVAVIASQRAPGQDPRSPGAPAVEQPATPTKGMPPTYTPTATPTPRPTSTPAPATNGAAQGPAGLCQRKLPGPRGLPLQAGEAARIPVLRYNRFTITARNDYRI